MAINELFWTPQAKAWLLFLILDAPPHENPQVLASLQQSIRKAAAKGIRIIAITASGINKSTEYLMRAIALATSSTYVFLTDDSGVGNARIKPTTDKFDVELRNILLVKLITKYAYTTGCQASKASMVSKAGPGWRRMVDYKTTRITANLVGAKKRASHVGKPAFLCRV